jgi:hypothetical protein
MAMINANVQKKKPKGLRRRIILALLALIIIAGAYLFFTYGSLPYAVITAKNLNSSTLISIMSQKVNSAAIVNLSYSGSIMINNTDPEVSFSYIKNGSQVQSYLKLRQIPSLVDMEATTYLNQTSGNGRGCVIYNFDSHNSTPTPICKDSAYPYSAYTTVLGYLFNLTSVGNISTSNYGLRTFKGQPCYFVSGTGSVIANEGPFNQVGYTPAIFIVTTCLSAQYNVPLNVTGVVFLEKNFLKNGDSISFNIVNSGMVLHGS